MLYKQFLKIIDATNEEFLQDFDYWLAVLPRTRQDNITASSVAARFDIPYIMAENILNFCVNEKILEQSYMVRCPKCKMFLAKKEFDELSNILFSSCYCHQCDKDREIDLDSIYVVYKRIESPNIPKSEFKKEVLKRMDSTKTINFNSADSLNESNIDLFSIYYNPSESAFEKFQEMKDALDGDFKTTKEKGDALENLVLGLFDEIKGVSATNRLKTRINQIDCTAFCKVHDTRLSIFNYLCPYIILECKNEKSSPSNSYFHKLADIMRLNEAKLGIIISRQSGGDPSEILSREIYLETKNTNCVQIIINLSDSDLGYLIDKRINLLEYLYYKIVCITTGTGKKFTFEMFSDKERDELVS